MTNKYDTVIPLERTAKRAVAIWNSDKYSPYTWDEFLERIIELWNLSPRRADFIILAEKELGVGN